MEVINFNGIDVEIHRKAFRRQVSVKVYPNTKVKLSAGMSFSQKNITAFLLENHGWLEKSVRSAKSVREQFLPKEFKSGENFIFLGKDYELEVVEADGEAFVIKNNKFIWKVSEERRAIYVSNSDLFKSTLRRSYEKAARRVITDRYDFWANEMGLISTDVEFKDLNSMWGSCCTRTKKITFNWKLVVFDLGTIDYVVIHELSHLVHGNHSKKFWSLVGQFCPEYKNIKKDLRRNHLYVDFLSKKSDLWT